MSRMPQSTAKLRIKRLVVLLMFLLTITTRTTRMLPTPPMRMMMLNMIGTRMGTTVSSLRRTSSSLSSRRWSEEMFWGIISSGGQTSLLMLFMVLRIFVQSYLQDERIINCIYYFDDYYIPHWPVTMTVLHSNSNFWHEDMKDESCSISGRVKKIKGRQYNGQIWGWLDEK